MDTAAIAEILTRLDNAGTSLRCAVARRNEPETARRFLRDAYADIENVAAELNHIVYPNGLADLARDKDDRVFGRSDTRADTTTAR